MRARCHRTLQECGKSAVYAPLENTKTKKPTRKKASTNVPSKPYLKITEKYSSKSKPYKTMGMSL